MWHVEKDKSSKNQPAHRVTLVSMAPALSINLFPFQYKRQKFDPNKTTHKISFSTNYLQKLIKLGPFIYLLNNTFSVA
jgi:hypothetical protein